MTRIAVQTLMRAAAVDMLNAYATDADIKLQVYRARPRSIVPPTAFVDKLGENIPTNSNLLRRTPICEVIVLHGLFDSGEAADQRDAFVDGFIEWSWDRPHQVHGNTIQQVTDIDDIPDYVNDWMAPEHQRTYYATRITLEGLATSG